MLHRLPNIAGVHAESLGSTVAAAAQRSARQQALAALSNSPFPQRPAVFHLVALGLLFAGVEALGRFTGPAWVEAAANTLLGNGRVGEVIQGGPLALLWLPLGKSMPSACMHLCWLAGAVRLVAVCC